MAGEVQLGCTKVGLVMVMVMDLEICNNDTCRWLEGGFHARTIWKSCEVWSVTRTTSGSTYLDITPTSVAIAVGLTCLDRTFSIAVLANLETGRRVW